ncbi:MAG: DNA polymerase III subunit delta [Alphaproteobacteria bacterium]|nr:DNA polymerase III subunit delta [Alphaproteobacteria bacterium]
MKIQFRQIESFVKAPDKSARVILVYGPDNGLVRERAAIIGKTVVEDLNDPFNVAALSNEGLIEDPARLPDEASAISMMGGDRLIRIDGGSDKITMLLKAYLKNPVESALVVIQAGELSPRSSLRKLCESAKNAAALPCYVEDERNVAGFIRTKLQEENMHIEPDAISWLASNIAGDRGRVRSELEKLITYKGTEDSSPISLAQAQAACGNAKQQSFDDLVYALGAKRSAQALKAYSILTEEGTAFIAIIRSLQNHFRRLHITKSYVQSGMDIDSAMKKLSPPVFFKQALQFKGQVNNWPLDTLGIILNKLTELEVQCKKTGSPVETLCSQAILGISKMRSR